LGPRGTAAFIVRAGESILRKKAAQGWGDFERDAASRFSNAIALHCRGLTRIVDIQLGVIMRAGNADN
jgi:hypothetical protein